MGEVRQALWRRGPAPGYGAGILRARPFPWVLRRRTKSRRNPLVRSRSRVRPEGVHTRRMLAQRFEQSNRERGLAVVSFRLLRLVSRRFVPSRFNWRRFRAKTL